MILAFTAAARSWTPLLGVLGGLCIVSVIQTKCQNRAWRRRQRTSQWWTRCRSKRCHSCTCIDSAKNAASPWLGIEKRMTSASCCRYWLLASHWPDEQLHWRVVYTRSRYRLFTIINNTFYSLYNRTSMTEEQFSSTQCRSKRYIGLASASQSLIYRIRRSKK